MSALDLPLRDLRAALASGQTHAESLYLEARERAAASAELNALLHTCAAPDLSRSGVLAGIPFVHKDNFLHAGEATTCGSNMLRNFVAPFDATVSARLRESGALCLGKANMDEFAMGSSNEHSAFGPARNPWDLTRVPGGSSGGSAALVAAGVVPFATGSDTGGSIRQPAAFCGVSGLKPSYGRVSRFGLVAYASSLDCPGVLARRAADIAEVLQVVAGHDPADTTSAEQPVPDYCAALSSSVHGLRIGIPDAFFGAGIDPQVAELTMAALRQLEAMGAKLVPLAFPEAVLAIPSYYVIATAEASSNLSRFDGVRYGHRCADPKSLNDLYRRSRTEGFGAEVKRRIMLGTFALSAGYFDAYYLRALKVRRQISDAMQRMLSSVDVLAGPTAPTIAFKLGEKLSDPVAMYAADINTVAVNLAGLPALSLPCGLLDAMPVGLQLIGQRFAEARLLQVAHQYQQLTDWHARRPPTAAASTGVRP